MKISLPLFFIAFSLSVITACSTVRTYELTSKIDQSTTGNKYEARKRNGVGNIPLADSQIVTGVNYFLPKQRVKFTLERKIQKPADVKKALDAATAALGTLSTSKTAKDSEVAILEQVLAATTVDAEKASINVQLNIAKAQQSQLAASVTSKTSERKDLQDRYDNAQNGVPSYDVSIALTEMEPDLKFGFRALPMNFFTRDDENNLKVNEKGLLDNAKTTVTDQSGQILIEAARAYGFTLGQPLLESTFLEAMAPGIPKQRSFTITGTVSTNFTNLNCHMTEERPVKIDLLVDITKEQEINDLNDQLVCLSTPYRVEVVKPNFNVMPVTTVSSVETHTARTIFSSRDHFDGLFYRSRLPYMFNVTQVNPGVKVNIVNCSNGGCKFEVKTLAGNSPYELTAASSLLMIPNEAPVSYIPMRAGALVKTIHEVEFTDGIVTSWESNRPSEALALVKVPFAMIDAVIASISQLIPLAGSYSTQQNSILTQQLQNQQTLKTLEELQQGMSEQEFMEQQTALAEAEAAKLEAEYRLDQRRSGNFVDLEIQSPE